MRFLSSRLFCRVGSTVTLAALLSLAAVTSACSEERRWKEEVLLSDGKTIVIDRGVTLGPRPAQPGQSKLGAVEYWLSFTNPATGRVVRWVNPGKLKPMILGFSDGVPYVVAVPISAYGYIEARCPDPAYFFFKYVNGWQPIGFTELPAEIRKRNLLPVYTPTSLKPADKGFVSRTQIIATTRNLPRHDNEVDPTFRGPPECVVPGYHSR